MKKYRSDIIAQAKNNNLDYMIDPTFRNINRLFALSFKNSNDDSTRRSLCKYYIQSVEIKEFNALLAINNFLSASKKQTSSLRKPIEMSSNNGYTMKFCNLFILSKLL